MSSEGPSTRGSRSRGRGGFRGGRGSGGRPTAGDKSSASLNGASLKQQPGFEDETEDDSEVREMRQKYGSSVAMLQEIYPDWTAVDLLFTLRDANGDMETAVARIADGLATQWSSATKAKKPAPKAPASAAANASITCAAPPARGQAAPRRGDSRGRGRGARGGSQASARPSRPAPSSSQPPAAAAAAPASTTQQPSEETSSWAAQVEEQQQQPEAQEAPAPAPAPVEKPTSTWNGWGKPPKQVQPPAPAAQAPPPPPQAQAQPPAAPASEPAATNNVAPAQPEPVQEKPAPKKPVPGAKLSWAQIAKPQEAPKVAPAVAQPTPPVQIQEAAALQEEAPAPPQPAPANDPWASTPAAAPTANGTQAVGEGWADSVLAGQQNDEIEANQQAYHHAAGEPDVAAAMPASAEQDPAGPLVVDNNAVQQQQPSVNEAEAQPTAAAPEAQREPVAAQLEAQVQRDEEKKQAQAPAPEQAQLNRPPGFDKPAAQPAAAAVEAPQQTSLPSMNVQFGSLNLFDQTPSQPHGAQPAQQQPLQPAQSPSVATQTEPQHQIPQMQQPPMPHPPPQNPALANLYAYPQTSAYLQQYYAAQAAAAAQASTPSVGESTGMPFQAPPAHTPVQPAASPYASLNDPHAAAYLQQLQQQQHQQQAAHQAASPAPTQPPAPQQQQQQQPDRSAYAAQDWMSRMYGAQQGYSGFGAAHGMQEDKQAPPQQPHPTQGYPNYGYPPYYMGNSYPYSQPAYTPSPFAQYQQSMQNYAATPRSSYPGQGQQHQQASAAQQPATAGSYRGQIPGPASYAQGYGYHPQPQHYMGAPQGMMAPEHASAAGGTPNPRSSYKNNSFGTDF